MNISPKYNGTIIGGIFMLGSIILMFTYIIPIITIVPAAFIEDFASKVVDNQI